MTTDRLLQILAERKVQVRREGSKLRLRAMAGVITPRLVKTVQIPVHLEALLARLPDTPPDPVRVHWDGLLTAALDGFAALLPRAKTQAHRNILADIYPTVARKMHQERNELLENLADDAKAVVDRWHEDRPLIGQGECRL